MKFYSGGDYKSAIREFSAAQQLAPADLNNYNLALCYDKLGDPEPAVQYYRAYLDKVPGTDKRAEIEASINRLDAASKSVAAKKADEARRAEEARKAAEARQAADDARAAEELAKKQAADEAKRAEEARKAAELARKTAPPPDDARRPAPIGGPVGPAPVGPAPVGGSVGGSSSGTPGSGTLATTGDAQLDRVSAIDVNAIRDQRVGGAASGMVDNRGGPATAGAAAGGSVDPNAGQPVAGQPPTGGMPAEQPKKPTPVYKKWWFWAVVAVSVFVVYSIASDGSESSNTGRTMLPLGPSASTQSAGGMTLLRW